MLTDKALQDFEAWMYDNYTELLDGHSGYTNYLNDIAITAKNAHIIEWLDSVGIMVLTRPYSTVGDFPERFVGMDGTWSYFIYDDNGVCVYEDINSETRQEATEAAILTANEIYNEQTTI